MSDTLFQVVGEIFNYQLGSAEKQTTPVVLLSAAVRYDYAAGQHRLFRSVFRMVSQKRAQRLRGRREPYDGGLRKSKPG